MNKSLTCSVSKQQIDERCQVLQIHLSIGIHISIQDVNLPIVAIQQIIQHIGEVHDRHYPISINIAMQIGKCHSIEISDAAPDPITQILELSLEIQRQPRDVVVAAPSLSLTVKGTALLKIGIDVGIALNQTVGSQHVLPQLPVAG